MILTREKRTSSRSRDHHGLFFMSKQRMCVWALERVHHSVGTLICCDRGDSSKWVSMGKKWKCFLGGFD